MFKEPIDKEMFYEIYGGQRFHGIVTPKDYPFIFLIHTEGKYSVDNLHVDGEGITSTVHFGFEGENDEMARGNRAVYEHATRNGVYNSLLLFELKDRMLYFIGEYEYSGHDRDEETGKSYFILKKVETPLDDVPVYYVEKRVENQESIISSIGEINGYFTDDEVIEDITVENLPSGVEEGDYIDSEFAVINSHDDSAAARKKAQHLFIIKNYNKHLRRMARKSQKVTKISWPEEAYFYCVNVGTGLTTFLVMKSVDETEVWCMDWGTENHNTGAYKKNINDCLLSIKKDFYSDEDFALSRLFISHPDTDHYSAFDEKYIDCNTEVWINPHIYSTSKRYLKVLRKLILKSCKIFEPIKKNSFGCINVLHPNKSIRYGSGSTTSKYYYVAKDKNNLSPVIEMYIQNRKLIITGDIEAAGWEWYVDAKDDECKKIGVMFTKKDVDVYIHSHHGSANGYYVTKSANTYRPVINNVYDLFEFKYAHFISGRTGSHSGTFVIHSGIHMTKPFGVLLSTNAIGARKYIKYDVITGRRIY